MSARTVQIDAPSRLHFGLLSFGHEDGRQFGGAGVMIDAPTLTLVVRDADQLRTCGPWAKRTELFARRWTAFHKLKQEPACEIEVVNAPRQHIGLGSGTQLGLSIAAGLNAFHEMPPSSPAELAISVERGLRSAVGTYGFAMGGLIVESGKLPREPIAPLDCHVDVPPAWRFVLIASQDERGLSGDAERTAFAELPAVPVEVSNELGRELRESLVPAATRAEFEKFSDSLFRYGQLAGTCFSKIQGGPYNGEKLNELVEVIRSMGITGVGQSSWGPTLFAALPDDDAANEFATSLRTKLSLDNGEVWVSKPNNTGATVRVVT